MPPFGDFMDLRRHEADAGFRVRDGLGIDTGGALTLRLDPSGPLYVNARGEVAVRTGDGVSVETASPPRLVSRVDKAPIRDLQQAVTAGAASISALSTTVATNTSDIATLAAEKAPTTDVAALELTVDDHETRIAALESAVAALEAKDWTYVVLSSDFDTTSGTAVDVTGLAFTPSANTKYEIEAILFMRTTLAAAGPRPGFSIPTGMTDNMWTLRIPTSTTAETMRNEGGTVANVAASTGLPVADTSYLAEGRAFFRTGATPSGDFKIILLSESAGTSVSVETGSLIRYRVIS